jgi:hypothetical protein
LTLVPQLDTGTRNDIVPQTAAGKAVVVEVDDSGEKPR